MLTTVPSSRRNGDVKAVHKTRPVLRSSQIKLLLSCILPKLANSQLVRRMGKFLRLHGFE